MSVFDLVRMVRWVIHVVSMFLGDVSNVSCWMKIARTENVRLYFIPKSQGYPCAIPNNVVGSITDYY